MRNALLLILTFTFYSTIKGQQPGTVSGEIFDVTGIPLTGCYIKIIDSTETHTLTYLYTAEKNTFSISIPEIAGRSAKMIIGKQGFTDSIIPINKITPAPKGFIKCNLAKAPLLLKGVTVTNTPVWQKGDTSFYRANSFSDGTDNKLQDLIEKIPDFSINSEGELFYKNKMVEKILVSGEDLFSNRNSLLLANFPSNAIETIQAIEDQASNPLLKDLTLNKSTIVNLGLKKPKLIKSFGSIDAEVNSKGLYSVSPVVFSLFGKTKSAFIGNRNNVGNSAPPNLTDDMEPPNLQWSNPFLLRKISFEQIQGLDLKYYIKNNLLDTRFKINTPLSKNVKSETELIYNSDRWLFTRLAEEQIQTDSTILYRNLISESRLRPVRMGVFQKVKMEINRKQNLDISFLILGTTSTSNSQQIQESDNTPDTLINDLNDKQHFLTINANYTNRINASTAITLDLHIGGRYVKQRYDNFSNSISRIENLGNASFNIIKTNRNLNGANWGLNLAFLKKAKHKLLIPSFAINHNEIRLTDRYIFADADHNLPDSVSPDFTNSRSFGLTRYTINFGNGFKVGKMNWKISGSGSVVKMTFPNPEVDSSAVVPAGSLFWNILLKKKTWNHELNINFTSDPLSLIEVYEGEYPQSPVAFVKYQPQGRFSRLKLNAQYLLRKDFRNKDALSLFLTHSTNFNSFIYQPGYNRIYSSMVYELINKPTSANSLTLNYMFSLWKRSFISIETSAESFGYLSKFEDQILRMKTYLFTESAQLEMIRKRNTIKLEARMQYYLSTLPQLAGGVDRKSRQIQTTVRFDYQYAFRKGWFANTSVRYFTNQSFNQGKSNYLLWDVILNYKPVNRNWGLSLTLFNLANTRYFETLRNSFPVVSSIRIPLTGRNVLAGFHYTF